MFQIHYNLVENELVLTKQENISSIAFRNKLSRPVIISFILYLESKMKALKLLLLFTLLFIQSCEKKYNPVTPETSDYFYPIKLGNQWEYSRVFSLLKYEPANASTIVDTFFTSTVIINVMKQEIIHDNINTFVFKETLIENNHTFTSDTYYTNSNKGLYLHAYRGPGHVVPKVTQKKRILFKGKYFSDIQEITSFITKAFPRSYSINDTLIYEIPPLQSLKYPLEIGAQWVYRNPDNPWHIEKKIVGFEEVDVATGKFDCFKIQWLYDIDNKGVWDPDIIFYDYICEQGLVKRSIIFKNATISFELEPIGTFDIKDESVLTKLNLE